MNFKPFFIHYNPLMPGPTKKKFRGFTAYIQPGDGFTVKVQTAFCSALDAFCRKTGREAAKTKPVIEINSRKLSGYLRAQQYFSMTGKTLKPESAANSVYEYVYKYML